MRDFPQPHIGKARALNWKRIHSALGLGNLPPYKLSTFVCIFVSKFSNGYLAITVFTASI